MSNIRRQSIISSVIVYAGFALGFLNTYLFAREGGFAREDYGMTGVFIAIANVMYSLSSVGMQAYILKFYPYYRTQLREKENDMITWALLTSLVGFALVVCGGLIFKGWVLKQYAVNSPKLVQYYFWLFPFGLGLTYFSLLEAYAWHFQKSVLTNFLREVLFRLFTTLLIVLTFAGIIRSFDLFIKLFACSYLVLAVILAFFLFRNGKLHFNMKVSKVTRRFYRKIRTLALFIWSANFTLTLSQVFDSLVIALVMKDGLAYAAIYTLAQNIASLIQAPQRGIITASIASVSQAWKEKDLPRIGRIYHRSSINQIIFSMGMFTLIWMNFTDGVFTFHLQKEFLAARQVFLFIGLMRIVDMGTGVNSQIIATSTYWRFDFLTGVVLILITLPLNYLLTKQIGVIGPAIANLVSMVIYNTIRYVFLFRKFKLQPFTIESVYPFLLAVAGYLFCNWLFGNQIGLVWIFLRSILFIAIYLPGILLLKVSPDIIPVARTILKRLRLLKD